MAYPFRPVPHDDEGGGFVVDGIAFIDEMLKIGYDFIRDEGGTISPGFRRELSPGDPALMSEVGDGGREFGIAAGLDALDFINRAIDEDAGKGFWRAIESKISMMLDRRPSTAASTRSSWWGSSGKAE